jgi:type I restriction enzyme, S subunit
MVSRGATVGRMCIVKTNEVFCLLGSVILIKVTKKINSNYLAYILRSPKIYRKLTSISGATAQQAIYLRDIKKIQIPLPSIGEQENIVTEIETRLSVCDNIEANIKESLTKAEALRQSILKKAFEGKLLNEKELEAVRNAPDWEPSEKLLERIKEEKKNQIGNKEPLRKSKKGR